MATISAKDVAALRAETGAGMMDCKKALEETGGDKAKAVEWLRAKGMSQAEKRADREVKQGRIEVYHHHNASVAVIVEINCETDFVARTDDFKNFCKDVAIHIASAMPIAITPADVPADVVERERRIFTRQVEEEKKPENIREKIVEGKIKKFFAEKTLLEQPFVKDDKQTVGDLLKAIIARTGENVQIRRFARFKLGEAI